MEKAYAQAVKAGDANRMARTSAMYEIETLRQTLELGAGDHAYPSQQRYLPDCNTDYQLYQRLDLTVRTEKDLQRILKDAKSKDVVFEVDPACGWTPSQIRDKVMQACFLLRKSPKSSNHNPVTNIYCVVFH